MLVGFINSRLENHEAQAAQNGTSEIQSDANRFKTEKIMKGTQAQAATPSRVTESTHSLGLVGPAGTNSKKQMAPVLIEGNSTALLKMNQTTTSAFSPPGDKLRLELM